MSDTHMYRVTRVRANPSYWRPKKSVKICTHKSLVLQLKAIRQHIENYERYKEKYNLTEPSEQITKIERAPLGEFEDVTPEFLESK